MTESRDFRTIIEDLIESGGHQTYCDIIQFELATFCTCDWDGAVSAAWKFLADQDESEKEAAEWTDV